PKVPTSPARPGLAWCGWNAESATDRTPEVELSAPQQIHVVYAIPSDGTDAFASYASPIASDAAAIDVGGAGRTPHARGGSISMPSRAAPPGSAGSTSASSGCRSLPRTTVSISRPECSG